MGLTRPTRCVVDWLVLILGGDAVCAFYSHFTRPLAPSTLTSRGRLRLLSLYASSRRPQTLYKPSPPSLLHLSLHPLFCSLCCALSATLFLSHSVAHLLHLTPSTSCLSSISQSQQRFMAAMSSSLFARFASGNCDCDCNCKCNCNRHTAVPVSSQLIPTATSSNYFSTAANCSRQATRVLASLNAQQRLWVRAMASASSFYISFRCSHE